MPEVHRVAFRSTTTTAIPSNTKALEKYNATMRGVAETNGVTLVDLARMLPKDSFLYVDRMHFSNAGAAKVGKIIANAMCEKLQREFPKWVDRSAGNCGEAHKE